MTAEALARLVARRRTGRPGSSRAGGAAVAQVLRARVGVRARLADGAGFVPGSQATAREVVRLLRALDRRPLFSRSLARPGQGTLAGRRVPAGCRAKTGTLRRARTTALAGVCRGRVFAVLTVGPSTQRARAVQDRIAGVLARR